MTETILNVDDRAANRYLKSRVLRGAGFEVVEAATGAAALELAVRRAPALVLLDLKLPDISGFEVARRLKGDVRTRHIPIVHISATFIGATTKAHSEESGAEMYLAEPVGAPELVSTVRTLLRLRAVERRLEDTTLHLNLAAQGGMATWDMPLAGGTPHWSPQLYAILGLDPSLAPSAELWLDRIRPADRRRAEAFVRSIRAHRGAFSFECGIVRADDGGERYLAVHGHVEADACGRRARVVGVAIDVTERRIAEAEQQAALERAREAQKAAEEAVRMKDEFLAVLSHELRTPMTAVLGWLHLLRSGRVPPERHQEALAIIERNALQQVQIVDDLLDVSRIITGKLELETELVALDQAVRAAVETSRVQGEPRNITIDLDVGPGPWNVRGSAGRLQQVFGNLLSNAVKFSCDGGAIEVVVERVGDGRALVSVTDHGEGIAPALLPYIFDTFRQADSSTRRRHGGLGLGLAIVKSLVELHGGRVWASSAGAGCGSRLVVELPLEPAEQAAVPGDETPMAVSRESLAGMRVLAVEDEHDHRALLGEVLRASGADVRCASGGEEALAILGGWRPDVLVLDIGMPGVDGYELLGRLREAVGATPEELPAIALTGFASSSDAARALRAGFQAHCGKPFQPERLVRRLARLGARTAGS